MYKKYGFTISELLISMTITISILSVAINILIPCGKIWKSLDSSVMNLKKISVAMRIINSEFSKCDSSSVLFSKSYEAHNSQVVSFISPIDKQGNITSRGMNSGNNGIKKRSVNSDVNWRNVTIIYPVKTKNKSDEFSLYMVRLYPKENEDNIFNLDERMKFINEFSIKDVNSLSNNRKYIRLLINNITSISYDSPTLFNGGCVGINISYKTDKGKIKNLCSSTEMMNGRK